MPSVGDRIRQVREHRRMTQDRLAEVTNISKGFLSDLENDKRNVSSEYLLRIANSLGTSVDYLLTGQVAAVDPATQEVVIPPELSQAARQLQLSYSQTLDLLKAHESVVARRSNKEIKRFTINDWITLHKALKEVFG